VLGGHGFQRALAITVPDVLSDTQHAFRSHLEARCAITRKAPC